jgi:hypothetical protein
MHLFSPLAFSAHQPVPSSIIETMKVVPTVTSVPSDPLPSKLPFSGGFSTIYEDAPSIAESEVSYDYFSDTASVDSDADLSTPKRLPLQWNFHGLTLWVEFEEFDNDLTKAVRDASAFYGTEEIPQPHATAAYGMEHLSVEEAKERLYQIPSVLENGKWPVMQRPVAVKQDIAVEGRPGQVCSISWAELTLTSNEEHEKALDQVYSLFGLGERTGPWTPHISLAYDNPEETVLNLGDTISYVTQHPTLLCKERKVEAISLWSTEGKLADWKCIDRIRF